MARADVVNLLEQQARLLRQRNEEWLDICKEDPKTWAASDRLGRSAERLGRLAVAGGRPFTIALFGEFKVGKSTFINSLLGLTGGRALSSEVTPDTAACIRLTKAANRESEKATIILKDGSEIITTWEEARKYTSHVFLDEHPDYKRKAGQLLEVIYAVDAQFLDSMDLLDLPGVGTREAKDDELTRERLLEAEGILWIIGPAEPGGSSKREIEVLRDFRTKVTPVLNVWESIEDPEIGIGENALKQIEESIRTQFAECYPASGEIVRYSALPILEEIGRGANPQATNERWGYARMTLLISEYQSGGMATDAERVANLARKTGVVVDDVLNWVAEQIPYADRQEEELLASREAMRQREREKERTKRQVREEVRSMGAVAARDIAERVSKYCEPFIEDQLQISNFDALKTALQRDGKAKLNEVMADKFVDEYLNIKVKPNWLDGRIREFAEDAANVIVDAWMQFWTEDLKVAGPRFSDDNFERVTLGLGERLVQGILDTFMRVGGILIVAGLLVAIPGGAIVDAIGVLAMILVSIITDPLKKHRQSAILRSQLACDNMRFTLAHELSDAVQEAENECVASIDQVLGQYRDVNEAKLATMVRARDLLGLLEANMSQLRDELNELVS